MAAPLFAVPMDDGAGAVATETVLGRDLYFTSVGEYPKWVPGWVGDPGTALQFSAGTNGAYAAMNNSVCCNYRYKGITIMCRFMVPESATNGVIFKTEYMYPYEIALGVPLDAYESVPDPYFALWVGPSTRKLHFGWRSSYGVLTGYRPSIYSLAPVNDGQWHTVVIKLGGGGTAHSSHYMYLDGVLQWRADQLPVKCNGLPVAGTNVIWPDGAFDCMAWFAGGGKIIRTTSFCGGYWYDSGYGSVDGGRIGELRAWCGLLTDAEIAALFELPPPRIIAPALPGKPICSSNQSSICEIPSTSSRCTPTSSVRLVPGNR